MGVGQIPGLEDPIKAAADRVLEKLLPKIQEIAGKAAEAAQPVISRVIREDVVPYAIGGILVVGAVSALIGSLVARAGMRRS